MDTLFTLAMITLLVVSLAFAIAGLLGAIWVPAFSNDTTKILQSLNLKPGAKVYEFGCGDGRFLRKAAQYPVTVIGYEINPFICKLAQLLCHRYKNISVRLGNGWTKSFADADVTFVFLMPKFMGRLGTKLKAEMKPGTTVISYMFAIPNLKLIRHENNCYFYKI